MNLSKRAVYDSDIKGWSTGLEKLTVKDVCRRFQIDVENNRRNRFLWNIICRKFNIEVDSSNSCSLNFQENRKCVITDEVLIWMGYKGFYNNQKQRLSHLLRKNKHIQYCEISDKRDPRKKYFVLDTTDFESIVAQMRTCKALELVELISIMKTILVKYSEYEKWYQENSTELLRRQNIHLIGSVDELKSVVLSVKQEGYDRELRAEERERRANDERRLAEDRERRAEDERRLAEDRERRAEDERRLAEDRERRAEDERRLAEEERSLAQERECLAENKWRLAEDRERRTENERKRAEERSNRLSVQIKSNIHCLRHIIAPKVVPCPIHPNKRYRLGLYKTALEGQLYIMRRQLEGWNDAERRLYNRSMERVHTWEDVSHAINIGNLLKRQGHGLLWYAKGNIIYIPEEKRNEITYATVIKMIDDIILRENEAHWLANDNASIL